MRRVGGVCRRDLKTESGGTTLIFIAIHEKSQGYFLSNHALGIAAAPLVSLSIGCAEGSGRVVGKLSEREDLIFLPANKVVYVC